MTPWGRAQSERPLRFAIHLASPAPSEEIRVFDGREIREGVSIGHGASVGQKAGAMGSRVSAVDLRVRSRVSTPRLE